MEIIAVLDLKNNQIVHARRGERGKYAPPKSYLFETEEPLDIVNAIQNMLGIKKFYVADLDAIMNQGDNTRLVQEILNTFYGTEVYLDAGINDLDKARYYMDLGINKVIIGSETLKSLEDLKEIVINLGTENVIFSLDSINGRMLSKDPSFAGKSIVQGLEVIQDTGIRNVILLELKKVGAESGYDRQYFELIKRFSDPLNIFIGGGVRGMDDIHALSEIGVRGIMTATAIYNGAINASNMDSLLV